MCEDRVGWNREQVLCFHPADTSVEINPFLKTLLIVVMKKNEKKLGKARKDVDT